MSDTNELFHTDQLLAAHGLLVKQTGWGDKAKLEYVDLETKEKASLARVKAFEKAASGSVKSPCSRSG
jgi:hypothetical protein